MNAYTSLDIIQSLGHCHASCLVIFKTITERVEIFLEKGIITHFKGCAEIQLKSRLTIQNPILEIQPLSQDFPRTCSISAAALALELAQHTDRHGIAVNEDSLPLDESGENFKLQNKRQRRTTANVKELVENEAQLATMPNENGPIFMKFPNVDKTQILLGRSQRCHFAIPEPIVSFFHCRVMLQKGFFYVTDFDSTNGTFINGVRVTAGIANQHDVLSVGSYEFILQIGNEAEDVLIAGGSANEIESAEPPPELLEHQVEQSLSNFQLKM